MADVENEIVGHLRFLYGEERGQEVGGLLLQRLRDFRAAHPELQEVPPPEALLTEKDALLITYGDQIQEPGEAPLQTLAQVLERYVDGVVSGVHLLPFFPYSSDDGFSVIDYTQVNPEFGDWEDVARLDEHFRLMFDAVINHISRESAWFQSYLEGDSEYEDYFIEVEEGTDLSAVVRPRAKPLLTPVETPEGEKQVWTTFSADQIDLDYANPEVLRRIVDVLLFYVEQGAEFIRLDAIAYVWKELGTSCIHLSETHRLVQLFRSIFDMVAPGTLIITETNVPHEENISYFGDGTNEAQLVYQFPLPPLVLHTFVTGDATKLTEWAASLDPPSRQTTFFNFLASHDGVGVRPVEGILSPEEVEALVERTKTHGGHVSYKTNKDGSQSVYELNISYFDALSDPTSSEPLSRQVDRFVASQAIMLALQGVPGIYVHSLFGSRSWRKGVEQTGRYRTINREKFDRVELESALEETDSLRHRVFSAYRQLLKARCAHPAFHPNGSQDILDLGAVLFALARSAPEGRETLLCLHEVSGDEQRVRIGRGELPWKDVTTLRDVLSGAAFRMDEGALALELAPYQVLWLERGT